MSRPGDYLVRDPRQLRALASPVRMEVVDALHVLGRASIAEVADLVGRPADALYYHFRLLTKVGLVVPTGSVPRGRRSEERYETVGERLKLDLDPMGDDDFEALDRIVGSSLRLVQRELHTSYENGLVRYGGPRRNTWFGRIKGWLTDEQLGVVQERIEAILDQVAGPRSDSASLHAFTFVLSPTAVHSRARAST